LRDIGNTVIVVEHDEDAIKQADFVIDIGPGAGVHGGEIIAVGTPDSRRLCNDIDKDVTKNILTQFSINKWPSSDRLSL
jgi:excinuclease UvrABC ATPase subunit